MKKFIVFIMALLVAPAIASAQEEEMSQAQVQRIIDREFLTENVKQVSEPIRSHVDYMVNNYQRADMRKIILNMEESEQKIAKQQRRGYVPYDRRINMKNPNDIQRFLHKRVNTIY